MNFLFIALVCLILSLLSAVWSLLTTKQWLDKANLTFLLQDFINAETYSIGLILLSIISLVLTKLTLGKIQITVTAAIIFASAMVQYYYGLSFKLYPEAIISSKWESWLQLLNQKEIIAIQEFFQCCGFFKSYEFIKDKCTLPYANACYPTLMSNLRNNFLTTGTIFLLQASLILIALGFIFVVGRTRRHHSNRTHNQLISNTPEPVF
ncbi:hypothetical protein TVAG_237120 [Trichomonas vaginalis G3]|uniref:Tetraspanin family protein n=1 Tax=Trichomonas vaginalis (strain ATCC PRA-98 / G3) TaxID=412133 RepID=A2DCR2_TRIV3|nr:hypothetical protein TVAGG3_0607160 [Trichomonas vaginalis G3]EAY21686.1 hypothetical protein TVAG_237120 [Trichomonas vaginalis G3]KAI5524334.1 hypothetical protein TVAGG3_0607160 [Trichomonas vaginalis G3]|eukprot:XP_001582672.1 hypothetical protein [Trichomonas vaginalis G3]